MVIIAEEEAEKVSAPEAVKDYDEKVPFGYNRVAARIYPWGL